MVMTLAPSRRDASDRLHRVVRELASTAGAPGDVDDHDLRPVVRIPRGRLLGLPCGPGGLPTRRAPVVADPEPLTACYARSVPDRVRTTAPAVHAPRPQGRAWSGGEWVASPDRRGPSISHARRTMLHAALLTPLLALPALLLMGPTGPVG